MTFQNQLPTLEQNARQALYEGTIYLLPGNTITEALVDDINQHLNTDLGEEPRQAQFQLSNETFYERIGALRKTFYTQPKYHQAVREAMASVGFDPEAHAFDPIRLRVVTHLGYENPKAAPVYYPHRDTWYANPQSQLTWWIPLHDVDPEETFEFYPEYFRQGVNNDSEIFDYRSWVQRDWDNKIGWQNAKRDDVRAYPQLRQEIEHREILPVTCKRGDLLIFAGAHLHRTLGQALGRTRFSIDFRTVHLADEAAGLGAPNVDNRSTGSTLPDHVGYGQHPWGARPC